ncbi:uncharacterized protein BJ171DRAFT_472306 [Polychytrium aggregatum]|uniref:uncharacterized protein n=1 Tax=Polychytrium aggregatum TaxID=110093 RepID=UPI0022FEFC4E|nr:uncharacterized protein BJ171DRAFT_472306 [Polychytrium aggregatum]KAI9208031.1 hypothetical protein BJ171DRAFT_472306 [Polychytrium aggregatum]
MEQDPSLDARLDRYDLSQYRPLLQQAGIRTIESLLGLPDDRLKAIGLDDSAIERVRKAHNKHANATCTPPGTATGEHKCNSPWVIPDWKCAAGFKTHHIFISYRVASESEAATELHSTLSVVKNEDDQDCQCLSLPVLKYAGGRLIHTYLDKRCLIDGKSWEQGFRNGLVNSQVIVLLLSENGLQRTKEAHKKPDNQFLEASACILWLHFCLHSRTETRACSIP